MARFISQKDFSKYYFIYYLHIDDYNKQFEQVIKIDYQHMLSH